MARTTQLFTSSPAASANPDCSALIQSNPREHKPHLGPGISKPIFEAIRAKAKEMRTRDRLCVLLFTDSALEPHVDYSSHQDCLVGFEDDGSSQSAHAANTVSMCMLRGIFGRWKQPVGFVFTDSTMWHHQAAFFIKEIVKEAKEARLQVVACICNPRHVLAVDFLLQETRKSAEERGERVQDNTFVVGRQQVVAIFDPITLFLAVRDALLERDILYDGRKVKWQYIKEAYEVALENAYFPLTWKLTLKHVDPAEIDRGNVSACAQTFSATLGAFICNYAGSLENGKLPFEAFTTGLFVLIMNNIFDSVTVGLVFGKSFHLRAWLDLKDFFTTVVVKIPTDDNLINLWMRTLNGLIAIRKNLLYLGYHSFPVSCFNLDPLENSLDVVRRSNLVFQKGQPTCKLFVYYYWKALSVKHIYHCYPTRTSREWDDLKHLVQIKHFAKFVSWREEGDLPVSFANVTVDYEDEKAVKFVIRYLRKIICAREFVCAVSLRNLYGSDKLVFLSRFKKEALTQNNLTSLVKSGIIKSMIEVYSYTNFLMNSRFYCHAISKKIVNHLNTFINFNFEDCPHTSQLQNRLIDKFVRTIIREHVLVIQKSVTFISDETECYEIDGVPI